MISALKSLDRLREGNRRFALDRRAGDALSKQIRLRELPGVQEPFAIVLGSVCLALALAFGLGGREVAGRFLQKEYDRRRSSGGPGRQP